MVALDTDAQRLAYIKSLPPEQRKGVTFIQPSKKPAVSGVRLVSQETGALGSSIFTRDFPDRSFRSIPATARIQASQERLEEVQAAKRRGEKSPSETWEDYIARGGKKFPSRFIEEKYEPQIEEAARLEAEAAPEQPPTLAEREIEKQQMIMETERKQRILETLKKQKAARWAAMPPEERAAILPKPPAVSMAISELEEKFRREEKLEVIPTEEIKIAPPKPFIEKVEGVPQLRKIEVPDVLRGLEKIEAKLKPSPPPPKLELEKPFFEVEKGKPIFRLEKIPGWLRERAERPKIEPEIVAGLAAGALIPVTAIKAAVKAPFVIFDPRTWLGMLKPKTYIETAKQFMAATAIGKVEMITETVTTMYIGGKLIRGATNIIKAITKSKTFTPSQKLTKIRNLYEGAGTAGERTAARSAYIRLGGKAKDLPKPKPTPTYAPPSPPPKPSIFKMPKPKYDIIKFKKTPPPLIAPPPPKLLPSPYPYYKLKAKELKADWTGIYKEELWERQRPFTPEVPAKIRRELRKRVITKYGVEPPVGIFRPLKEIPLYEPPSLKKLRLKEELWRPSKKELGRIKRKDIISKIEWDIEKKKAMGIKVPSIEPAGIFGKELQPYVKPPKIPKVKEPSPKEIRKIRRKRFIAGLEITPIAPFVPISEMPMYVPPKTKAQLLKIRKKEVRRRALTQTIFDIKKGIIPLEKVSPLVRKTYMRYIKALRKAKAQEIRWGIKKKKAMGIEPPKEFYFDIKKLPLAYWWVKKPIRPILKELYPKKKIKKKPIRPPEYITPEGQVLLLKPPKKVVKAIKKPISKQAAEAIAEAVSQPLATQKIYSQFVQRYKRGQISAKRQRADTAKRIRELRIAALLPSEDMVRLGRLVGRKPKKKIISKVDIISEQISEQEQKRIQAQAKISEQISGQEMGFPADVFPKQALEPALARIPISKMMRIDVLVPPTRPRFPPLFKPDDFEPKKKKKRKKKVKELFPVYRPSLAGIERYKQLGKVIAKPPEFVGLGERPLTKELLKKAKKAQKSILGGLI